jgi:hypothetical protein
MNDKNESYPAGGFQGSSTSEREMFFFFRPESGVVTSSTQCHERDAQVIAEHSGSGYARGQARPGLDFFESGEVKARVKLPIVVDGLTLRNVPFPSVLTVGGFDHDVNEGVVELDLGTGKTTIAMLFEPYLNWEVVLENQTP